MRKIENKQIFPEFGNILKTPVEVEYHGVLPEEVTPEEIVNNESLPEDK